MHLRGQGPLLAVLAVVAVLAVAVLALVGAVGPAGATDPGSAAHDIRFSGVACPSAHSCLAVGWFDDEQGRREPLSERFDGTTWQRVALPALGGTNTVLTAIGCSASSFCLATGTSRGHTATPHHNIAVAWNGARWRAVPIDGPGYGILHSISCAGPSACFATGRGQYGFAALWRRGATSWTRLRLPALSELAVGGVSCGGPRDCVLVGTYAGGAAEHPLAMHWNGRRWARMSVGLPAKGELRAVSCPVPGRCTAVGTVYVPGSRVEVPVAQVRVGTRWHEQAAPEYPGGGQGSGVLDHVGCASPAVCVATGGGPVLANRSRPYVAARGGDGAWAAAPLPSPDRVTGVACAATCVVVGWARTPVSVTSSAVALAGTTPALATTSPVEPAIRFGATGRPRRVAADSPNLSGRLSAQTGSTAGRSRRTRPSTPLTKRGDSSVDSVLTSSTASSIATGSGTSERHSSSKTPSRSTARSTSGIRSSVQPSAKSVRIWSMRARLATTPSTSSIV